jgi:MFS family permease
MPAVTYTLQRFLGMPYPKEHRSNFIHLYGDIFWFGVLNGSIVIFLAVYISRLGATPVQTGLLTALPALANLIFSIPAGKFGTGKRLHIVTRWAWVANRIFYAFLIPLPVLLPQTTQIWVILGIVLVMNIPGTLAVVIGNAFFADTVPVEWRSQVVGLRNAMLALTTMLTAFIVGQVLRQLPFEQGYQVVFAVGFLGSMMSCFHLFLIRPVEESQSNEVAPLDNQDDPMKVRSGLRVDILRGPFNKILLATLAVQSAVFIPNPIFPLYQVNVLHLSDQTISLGSSLFWIVYLITSTQSSRFTQKWGFRKTAGIGMAGTSFSTLLFTLSFQNWIYATTQLFGGIAWPLFGIGMINYVYASTPPHDRPAYMVWYNLAVNGATLLSGLIAPQIANQIGLTGGMLLAVVLRLLAGIAVLRWG